MTDRSEQESGTDTVPVHGIVITPGPWEVVGDWGGFSVRLPEMRPSGAQVVARCDRLANREHDATAIAALPDLLNLVARSYRALHRGEWEDGETESELCDRINDVMCDHFGNDWLYA